MRTISSACPKCGLIKKSGKTSCCGRGGSWFKSCGSGGNAKLHHTWYEGIQVCKSRAQSRTVIDHAAQYKIIDSSNRTDTTNSKVVITTAKTITFTPAEMISSTLVTTTTTTLINMSINTSTITSVSTLTTYGTVWISIFCLTL